MRFRLFLFGLFLFASCQPQPKIDLNSFLIGGSWCGKSQMAGTDVCLQFFEDKVLVKIEGQEGAGDYFQYAVLEINEDEQKILWEMKGEGLVNIFKVIDQNTVALTLEDIRMEPSRFVRIN
ncbi:MAG: hypothetical protein P8H87_03955 [Flavobacteriaceae bacterium]|nr:hypothetical protein [Flavobacteriaceae bacterium]